MESIKIVMAEGSEDLFPRKAHSGDAAWDLRARVALELPVGRSTLVPTGVFIELPEDYEAPDPPQERFGSETRPDAHQLPRNGRFRIPGRSGGYYVQRRQCPL